MTQYIEVTESPSGRTVLVNTDHITMVTQDPMALTQIVFSHQTRALLVTQTYTQVYNKIKTSKGTIG